MCVCVCVCGGGGGAGGGSCSFSGMEMGRHIHFIRIPSSISLTSDQRTFLVSPLHWYICLVVYIMLPYHHSYIITSHSVL